MHLGFQPDALPPFILPEMPLDLTLATPVAQEQNHWNDVARSGIVSFRVDQATASVGV
jgi:hypothetical protein